MNAYIRRKNDAVHFEATNERGITVQIDGTSAVGGDLRGMRPMELLLVSVASCSAIDLVEILKRQRQPLKDIHIVVSGERPEEVAPRPFKSISIHFRLFGDLDETKSKRAVKLAVEKYCSAAETLDRKVEISHSFEIKSEENVAYNKE